MQAPIFFFATCGTADAQRDDEVSGDLTICIDCQVSAAVVGRQPCLAGRIAELRETRQKRSARCRRHADFKEVCKYQRLAGVCHIDCGRDCKRGCDAAAVSKQQTQLDDDIACDAEIFWRSISCRIFSDSSGASKCGLCADGRNGGTVAWNF